MFSDCHGQNEEKKIIEYVLTFFETSACCCLYKNSMGATIVAGLKFLIISNLKKNLLFPGLQKWQYS